MKPIRSILTIYTTRNKRSGYTRWAFSYVRTKDSESFVRATITGNESNIKCALHYDKNNGWRNDYFYYIEEMGEREFDKFTKNFEYAGCDPDKIREFVINKFEDKSLI